jgi:hypothetical protein
LVWWFFNFLFLNWLCYDEDFSFIDSRVIQLHLRFSCRVFIELFFIDVKSIRWPDVISHMFILFEDYGSILPSFHCNAKLLISIRVAFVFAFQTISLLSQNFRIDFDENASIALKCALNTNKSISNFLKCWAECDHLSFFDFVKAIMRILVHQRHHRIMNQFYFLFLT